MNRINGDNRAQFETAFPRRDKKCHMQLSERFQTLLRRSHKHFVWSRLRSPLIITNAESLSGGCCSVISSAALPSLTPSVRNKLHGLLKAECRVIISCGLIRDICCLVLYFSFIAKIFTLCWLLQEIFLQVNWEMIHFMRNIEPLNDRAAALWCPVLDLTSGCKVLEFAP